MCSKQNGRPNSQPEEVGVRVEEVHRDAFPEGCPNAAARFGLLDLEGGAAKTGDAVGRQQSAAGDADDAESRFGVFDPTEQQDRRGDGRTIGDQRGHGYREAGISAPSQGLGDDQRQQRPR